jgi:hypothetical protein
MGITKDIDGLLKEMEELGERLRDQRGPLDWDKKYPSSGSESLTGLSVTSCQQRV